MRFLDTLPQRYSVVLCDLWGVVHDGHRVLPGVTERLGQWQADGLKILFITNAPRTGAAVRAQLDAVGLPMFEDALVSAGEAGAVALLDRPVGFCGTEADRHDLEGRGLRFVDDGFTELACAGLYAGQTVADYDEDLARWRSDDVLMHCLNPDRIVLHRGQRMICAGALADAYEELGGQVRWYGKPYPAIYELALELAGLPPKEQVLAIGDGLQTDVLGAARFGIDCLFVSGGIHAGEPFPPDFADRHDLGEWTPVATVPGIGIDQA